MCAIMYIYIYITYIILDRRKRDPVPCWIEFNYEWHDVEGILAFRSMENESKKCPYNGALWQFCPDIAK